MVYSWKRIDNILELNFVDTPEKLKGDYLDMCKGIETEVKSTTRFDENSDLSMTSSGRVDTTRASSIMVEDKFPISDQGYTLGKLLDGRECQILLDTGASKSFMSKLHYLRSKSSHSLPECASKPQTIQVGNGKFVSVLFIIPIMIDIHGHRFEIFTLV